ncbi:MAG: D-cysteine desulfhydrase family protein [Desulfobacterales bacterium]|nr:D-cysteine desulfhydrase family protein [Desulfobacterales bacterium]
MARTLKIDYPDRLHLAWTPTPLQKMVRLGEKYGVEIYFKRDDLTGCELSGNKIRKLEFILAEAAALGADTILTCGGAQSNHCRAAALAATRVGLKSLLLLRAKDPNNPPPADGNILLDLMAGSEIVWITPDEYKRRDEFFQREAERLRAMGRKPYIIPEGGSTALGSWGYIRAMDELASNLAELDDGDVKPTTVVSASGSGGTTAGLLLGADLLDMDIRVVGFNVCDDRDYFLNIIGSIRSEFIETYAMGESIDFSSEIEIVDGYVGRGYALSRPEELAAIRDLARLEGVILDPVYTGKAYFGMISELAKNPDAFGPRIVFVHTGGLFGLFPIAEQMVEALKG